MDAIFPTTVKTKKNDGNNANTGASSDYKNHQSSSHLSIMSLSVGDMGIGEDVVTEVPSSTEGNLASQLAAVRSSDKDLSTRFNNSLRLGRSKPGKRNSTNSEVTDISHSGYMDMSVATLGDRMSEFGDMSAARMSDSQANMSFVNVFEETDQDLCADEKL